MRNLWIAESRKQKFFSFDINPKLINSRFIKTFPNTLQHHSFQTNQNGYHKIKQSHLRNQSHSGKGMVDRKGEGD
jgi:hypothetical protein